MTFEYYIDNGSEKLRCGYTTGSCAALAAQAACEMLFSGKKTETAKIVTPKGIEVKVETENAFIGDDFACCAVRKDGGDDIDATDGMLIFARAEKSKENIIDGAEGIGRVTKDGLDQPKGNAAINSTPRKMISEEVSKVCRKYGYKGGIKITIYAPEGREIAKKTFNPNIGIVGGISIIGTSGIVEPKSLKALFDTIKLEIDVGRKEGHDKIILTPGNYGMDFLKENFDFGNIPVVQCSNFLGDAVECAAKSGYKEALLVGHAGKLIKLSGGIMYTHSHLADGRTELMALFAMLAGMEKEKGEEILNCISVDGALDVMGEYKQKAMALAAERAEKYLKRRSADMKIGLMMFSLKYGILCKSSKTDEILEDFGGKNDR